MSIIFWANYLVNKSQFFVYNGALFKFVAYLFLLKLTQNKIVYLKSCAVTKEYEDKWL